MNSTLLLFGLVLLVGSSAQSAELRYVGVVHPNEPDTAKQGSCAAVITTDSTGVAIAVEGRIHDPKKDRIHNLGFERGGSSTHIWDVDYDSKTAYLKKVRAESHPTDHLFGGLPDVFEIKDLHKSQVKLTIKRTVSYEGLWVAHQTLKCSGMTLVKSF